MIFVLSLELVKTYRVLFPLVDALRSFRVGWGAHMWAGGGGGGTAGGGGGHICAPPAVRRWLRPPAVRGLKVDC